MIQIAPWEKSLIKEIEKAIMMSDIGITPSNDGSVIRLVFPELTEDRRKELVKDIKKKGENAKVAVRNIRRYAIDHFKKIGKEEDLSEDEIKDVEEYLDRHPDLDMDDVMPCTLKEYLEDYASPDTKAVGEALIQKELANIPNEKVRGIASEHIRDIADGKRDFRF